MARILVTDDSAFLRRISCRILAAAGHQTLQACHGIECLQMVASEQPDVILLDLVMPEMDGLTVLRTLREQHSLIPVIILTADIQDSVREECRQWGASSFLNKPPKESQLLQALDKALGNKGETDATER